MLFSELKRGERSSLNFIPPFEEKGGNDVINLNQVQSNYHDVTNQNKYFGDDINIQDEPEFTSNKNYIPTSDDVINFSKEIIGEHMQYTEPPTRPPRPTKPAHPSSLPPVPTTTPTPTTTTTRVPIDQAIFPLEYFTESDVKISEKRSIVPGNSAPKVSHPIQYPSGPLLPPPRPKPAAVTFYQPPPTAKISQKNNNSIPKKILPPPRPQPYRPPTYSSNLTPEPGYSYSGPNPGFY